MQGQADCHNMLAVWVKGGPLPRMPQLDFDPDEVYPAYRIIFANQWKEEMAGAWCGKLFRATSLPMHDGSVCENVYRVYIYRDD